MKIPKRIKVGQYIYKVKFTPEEIRDKDGNLLFGVADHYKREILLDENVGKTQTEETFVHEIIHCLNNVYSVSQESEKEIEVERLGAALHIFIHANKEIFK